jgi:N-acetylmuramoyl-L-alanine amidase
MRFLVIFDDSHGIDTPGKETPKFPDGTIMKEHEFSYDVVEKANDLLREYDNVDVFFTASEKRDIPLDERVERVNSLYDRIKVLYEKIVLVSVHANAMKSYWNEIGNGTATFYYPYNMTDKAFAEIIQRNLIAKTKLQAHRGGVVEGNFQILREVKMTACLCECAFMDNIKEAELLRTNEFRQACAEGVVNGLLEYFKINQKKEADEVKVDFKKYNNGMTELRGNSKDLSVKIVDKKIWDITEYTNCTNGTFYWYDKNDKTYATSILYADGKLYQAVANHYPSPQSVFIIYKDNTVDLKRIKNLSELDLSKIRLVVGGVGLRNTQDPNFKYSPVSEGFTGIYADVLRTANKTVLGYNKRLDKVYLLTVKNVSHGTLLNIISDNSTGEAYDIAISLDGGGSTFMDANKEYVFQGENSRRIHNIIGFNFIF